MLHINLIINIVRVLDSFLNILNKYNKWLNEFNIILLFTYVNLSLQSVKFFTIYIWSFIYNKTLIFIYGIYTFNNSKESFN